ncbi:hypothetical protein [Yersinia pekkanenii]|uniref:Uncharacterized protein n=1 Tax=Yersinia pekkanenii TaxID=1288385 RepID=A0A0T9RFS9_9GAMM|nr:hypothetical protein [Yersinia pekkanenii]CNI60935.1 Uncharacterised protein [Yersinia pekkanenii]CRY66980.1 Uncharacterised protein [Yersinia pekkanenii]
MISIDNLTEAELTALHNRIVDRLKELQREKALSAMSELRIGDVVRFQSEQSVVAGIVIRLNKKSVTVHSAGNNRWNVSPELLTLVRRPEELADLEDELKRYLSNE